MKTERSFSMTESGTITSDMGIYDHIEKIVETLKKNGLEKCLSIEKRHLEYVTKRLDISPIQAILFSAFMEKSDDACIRIGEIASAIHCNNITIYKYMNECEELENKKLIRCNRSHDKFSFRVPFEVRESLRKFNEFKPEGNENLSIFTFFTFLERIFEERDNDELTSEALQKELQDLINLNMHLEFCKRIMSYGLCRDDFLLLLCFCHFFVNNDEYNIETRDIKFVYDNKATFKILKNALSRGSHYLIKSKYVEFSNSNGFINSDSWKLSDTSKQELLSELDTKENKNHTKNLILFDSIKPKEMFYNKKEANAIQTLSSLLTDEN